MARSDTPCVSRGAVKKNAGNPAFFMSIHFIRKVRRAFEYQAQHRQNE